MAESVVRIKLVGSAALKELQGTSKRAIQDVSAAEKKAAAESEKLAKKTADTKAKEAARASAAAIKAEQATLKEKTKAATDAARVARKAADEEAKEAERLTAHWRRLSLESSLVRQRAAEEATKVAAREAAKQAKLEEVSARKRDKEAKSNWRTAGGFVGGATAGVLAGAVSAGSLARNVAGVDDVQTRIQKANSFQERLVVATGQAGYDETGVRDVQAKVADASMASGKDANELVGVLESGQAKFNDLKFYADNLKEIAVMSKATGSDAEDFARALGYIKQAFNLTGKEAIETGYLMVDAANKGSIEVKNFARDFAPVAGVFAQGTKMSGPKGAREFLGVSQASGTLGEDSSVTATMVERFVATMARPDKQRDIRAKSGIDVRGKSPSQIIDEMANSKRFNKRGVQADIFGADPLVSKAVTALLSARQRVVDHADGAIDIKSIAGGKTEDGQAYVADIMKRMENSGLMDLQRKAIEMQNDTIAHLREYNDQIVAVVKVTNELEKRFGTLGLWKDPIVTGGTTAVGGAILTKLLTKGAEVAAPTAATTVATTAANTAAGLVTGGGLVTAATVAAPLALLAGAAMPLTNSEARPFTPQERAKGLREWTRGKSAGGDFTLPATVWKGEPVKNEVDMTVDVNVHDNRVEVRHRAATRGGQVNVKSPAMPGSGM